MVELRWEVEGGQAGQANPVQAYPAGLTLSHTGSFNFPSRLGEMAGSRVYPFAGQPAIRCEDARTLTLPRRERELLIDTALASTVSIPAKALMFKAVTLETGNTLD